MPDAKHTPRPWVTMGRSGEGHDTHWDIKHRSEHQDGGIFARVEVLHRTAEAIATGEANTRLICAAPDLLEALRVALAYNDACTAADGTGQFSWGPAARAAIAKATGETN